MLRRIEDNTRIALECLLSIDPQAALELAASLNFFWWTQGKLREGIGWLERAREAAPDAPAELRATSLFCEGFLVAHDTDDWHAAAKLIDRRTRRHRRRQRTSADPRHAALLAWRVRRLQRRSEVRRRSHPSRARDRVSRTRGPGAEASACGTRPTHGWRSGTRTPPSRSSRRRSIWRAQRGYGIGEMVGCNVMGEIWEARGELDTSRAFWERALHLRREVGAVAAPNLDDGSAQSAMCTARCRRRSSQWRAWPRSRETWPRRRGSCARASRSRRRCARSQPHSRWSSSCGRRRRSSPRSARRFGRKVASGIIEFNGTSVHVPDLKGLWHLRELVARPHEPVPALIAHRSIE